MAYPNEPFWSALQDGLLIKVNDSVYVLSVVDCGNLVAPHGQLVACDPFVGLQSEGNLFVAIPPGTYPVRVTLADVSGKGDGSHIREAYVTVILSDAEEVTRHILVPQPDGKIVPLESEDDSFVGFPVDAGTACFVDGGSLPDSMPPEDTWYEEIFDNNTDQSWFARMDDPTHIRAGIANITLPNAQHGENIIVVHSGWGDGIYPVVGGYDAQGNLVRVHIDFMVVVPSDDEDKDDSEE